MNPRPQEPAGREECGVYSPWRGKVCNLWRGHDGYCQFDDDTLGTVTLPPDPFHFRPPFKSKMILFNEQIMTVQLTTPKPNAWYRFWQRFLCGIRWEDVS